MRKNRLFAIAFVIFLSVSGYAEDEDKGHPFFSVSFYHGFFSDDPILIFEPKFMLKMLDVLKISGNWEFPKGPGNIALGLEAGYSSGSKFGGSGSVDFIPVTLNAAYVFPLARAFYVGPSLKVGGLGIIAEDWKDAIPIAGVRLDAELRSQYFPLGLFVAGGIDTFPTAPDFRLLPVIEAGVRFPRGKFGLQGRANADNSRGSKAFRNTTGGPAQAQQSGAATQAQSSAGTGQTQSSAATGQTQSSAGTGQTQSSGGTNQFQQGTASQTQSTMQGALLGASSIIVLEDGRMGRISSVYFEPDTDVLLANQRSTLDAVGQQLAADPTLQLLLRAYAAPFHTTEGRLMVSESRARFCRDYFIQNYRIAAGRIKMESYGSSKTPETVTADWESYRCVELIITAN